MDKSPSDPIKDVHHHMSATRGTPVSKWRFVWSYPNITLSLLGKKTTLAFNGLITVLIVSVQINK